MRALLAKDSGAPLAEVMGVLAKADTHLAAITGAQTDRMTRDDGWRLLSVGRQLERLDFFANHADRGLCPGPAQAGRGLRPAVGPVRFDHHLPRPVPGPPRGAAAAAPAGARHRQPALAGLGGAHAARALPQALAPGPRLGRSNMRAASRSRNTGRWRASARPMPTATTRGSRSCCRTAANGRWTCRCRSAAGCSRTSATSTGWCGNDGAPRPTSTSTGPPRGRRCLLDRPASTSPSGPAWERPGARPLET